MKYVVDSNVLLAASKRAEPQASPKCVLECIRKLNDIRNGQHTVILDYTWKIINEYKKKSNESGQPGVGDVFLQWLLVNKSELQSCEWVHITPLSQDKDCTDFEEFPTDEELEKFDASDRKFVATVLAHPERPVILNATDSDWLHYQAALNKQGVNIEFLCPDVLKSKTQA